MKTSRWLRGAIAATATTLLVWPALPAGAETITADNVGEMTQKASTAADHAALAEYFRTQAEAAEKGAQKHRTMLNAGPDKPGAKLWNAHCKRLIKSYEEQAAAFSDLAQEQETLAKRGAEPQ